MRVGAIICFLSDGEERLIFFTAVSCDRFAFMDSFNWSTFQISQNSAHIWIVVVESFRRSWSGGGIWPWKWQGGKWGCLCQAQRSRCLKFLFWSLPTTCHFSFSFTTAQVADKGFSGNGGCEMGPQLGVYSTSPGRETKIINSAKGGFVPAGARTPDVFFSGQDEERWTAPPHFQLIGLRPVTMTGIFWPSTSRQWRWRWRFCDLTLIQSSSFRSSEEALNIWPSWTR